MSTSLPSNTYSNVRQLLQATPKQEPPDPKPSPSPNLDLYGALMALNPAAILFSNLALLQNQISNGHLVNQVNQANNLTELTQPRSRKRRHDEDSRKECESTDDFPEKNKGKRKAAFDAWHQRKLMELQTDDSSGIADSTTSHTPSCVVECKDLSVSTVAPSVAKELTAPKLSRHNDAAYYPNIQCILCSEWVCSRNRYMHIESHLQYRPYKCSLCGYDNRKEIFIRLHIKRTHKGSGEILYLPDADLEHRAWQLAEQCLQHTREILTSKTRSDSSAAKIDIADNLSEKLMLPYGATYRPKIFNSQRAEKSQLIEESRQMGLVPDFTEVASREEECGTCGSHILRHHAVLEEHVRTHLSQPAYRCAIEGCTVEHHAKNFINRHMKEVHKYRRAPQDLLEEENTLLTEFLDLCHRCFANFFTPETLNRVRYRCISGTSNKPEVSSNVSGADTCSTLRQQLSRPVVLDTCCQLCCEDFQGSYSVLYEHVKTHLSSPPFECNQCPLRGTNLVIVNAHIRENHSHQSDGVCNKFTSMVARQCNLLMNACFPNVPLQQALHDHVVNNNA